MLKFAVNNRRIAVGGLVVFLLQLAKIKHRAVLIAKSRLHKKSVSEVEAPSCKIEYALHNPVSLF